MSAIHVLNHDLTSKIAAGEVVERPASVVKELLENALDAGATAVSIDLIDGGKTAIRMVDNGSGISRDQVPLAFERFATSKLEAFDDLYHLASFGFRGEALPSIASVARVEMVTRTADAVAGTRILLDHGRTGALDDAGSPVGTAVTVTGLFDGVPVRKKFLKADAAEQAACVDVILRTAIAREGIKITVTAGGRTLLALPSTARLRDRIALALGREAADSLLPVQGERNGVRLAGYLSSPDISRANARSIFVYVNRRFVRDPLVSSALMSACRRVLDPKRYPVAILFLEIPPGAVDINVHPAKLEVRFAEPQALFGLVAESAAAALAGLSVDIPTASPPSPPATGDTAAPFRVQEALQRYYLRTGTAKLQFSPTAPIAAPPTQDLFLSPPPGTAAEPAEHPEATSLLDHLTYLGQVGGTYLIFSGPDGLVLMDQHAAHERILFEKIRTSADADVPRQQLLLPELVLLTPAQMTLLETCRTDLEALGLEVEPFGEDTVIIKAVPALVPGLDAKELLTEILAETRDLGGNALTDRREALSALIACKGAIKAGTALSPAEVEALCSDLKRTPNRATCPHGRPTLVAITATDLEKMFKRR